MSDYDNTNRGAIWGNPNKQTDTQPDYKGSINVDGVDYWLSAWKRKPGANPNSPALSFSVQRKEERTTANKEWRDEQIQDQGSDTADSGFEQDIPF